MGKNTTFCGIPIAEYSILVIHKPSNGEEIEDPSPCHRYQYLSHACRQGLPNCTMPSLMQMQWRSIFRTGCDGCESWQNSAGYGIQLESTVFNLFNDVSNECRARTRNLYCSTGSVSFRTPCRKTAGPLPEAHLCLLFRKKCDPIWRIVRLVCW